MTDADETKDAATDSTTSAATNNTAGASSADATRGGERRGLCVLRAGGRTFAVYAEEVEAVAEDLRPAPLPFAPPTVLGVVALRGRARTLIDPAALTRADGESPPSRPADDGEGFAVVALRGDEQLALAAVTVEPSVEVAAGDIASGVADEPFALGVVRLGQVTALLIDPSKIFEAAMRGTERRRKR